MAILDRTPSVTGMQATGLLHLVAFIFLLVATPATMAREHSATAALIDQPSKQYQATGEVSQPMAAGRALANCQAANPDRSTACELVTLDNTPLTTTNMIKAALPESEHPLFLWRYTSETATVYLAGSIHILKPNFYPLAEPFTKAFAASDTLVVEVDISAIDPATMQAKTFEYGTLPDGQSLDAVLPPELYAKLVEVGARFGLPIAQMGRFKPALISQQLAVLGLISVGYNPESGVENHFLSQRGTRQVEQLESLDLQLGVLMNQPLDMQIAMLRETIEQMDQFEPLTARLIGAYLSGDDAAFAEVFDQQSGTSELTQAFMRKLMDDRNVGMANKIKQYLDSSGTYFVLIGAAHYVGENNIIELLQQAGVKGTRLDTNSTL